MREKTIMIKDAPFTYMDEVGDPYVFNAMTPKDMESILELAATLLKECGIEFILSFGTLLGSVREGYFIKGDDDVDIIVTDEERLFESLPYLAAHGLYINRIFKTELYTFHSEGRKGHLHRGALLPERPFTMSERLEIRDQRSGGDLQTCGRYMRMAYV